MTDSIRVLIFQRLPGSWPGVTANEIHAKLLLDGHSVTLRRVKSSLLLMMRIHFVQRRIPPSGQPTDADPCTYWRNPQAPTVAVVNVLNGRKGISLKERVRRARLDHVPDVGGDDVECYCGHPQRGLNKGVGHFAGRSEKGPPSGPCKVVGCLCKHYNPKPAETRPEIANANEGQVSARSPWNEASSSSPAGRIAAASPSRGTGMVPT